MKKISVFALAAAVAAACCLGGCGGGNTPERPPNVSVQITFDAAGGAFDNGSKSVVLSAADGKVKTPEPPKSDGYAFAGWFNGSSQFSPDTAHDADVTYTAAYVSGNDARVYEKLFDMNSVVSFDINMSDAQWKKLDADYDRFSHHKSPIYRLADSVTVSIDGDGFSYDFYYEEVGVRMKGNTSRRRFYGDGGFFANVHFKLSFGETFDDEEEYSVEDRKVWTSKEERKHRKNRTFGGMEKLDMKYNKNDDETYIKDIYAMKLFRDNGIVAPHATLCAVSALERDSVKKNLGIYMLYEAVDSVFIARNFPQDADGDLYKCSWGSGSGADLTTAYGIVGVENELKNEFYTYDKKTNKKATDQNGNIDFSSMTDFIEALNTPSAVYSELIDVDYFARFEAVNYLVGNPDCIRNNYNNYYVYFRGDGRAVFIPYDYDRCFGITKDWAPNNACLDLTPFDAHTSGGYQQNPLYVELIIGSADNTVKSAYVERLLELADGNGLSVSEFDRVKNIYKTHYDNATVGALETNRVRFDAKDTGNIAFADYVSQKLDVMRNGIGY